MKFETLAILAAMVLQSFSRIVGVVAQFISQRRGIAIEDVFEGRNIAVGGDSVMWRVTMIKHSVSRLIVRNLAEITINAVRPQRSWKRGSTSSGYHRRKTL